MTRTMGAARPRFAACVHAVQNSELLSLMYGALVAQLVADYEEPEAVNAQLEKMCPPTQPLHHLFGSPRLVQPDTRRFAGDTT